MVGDQWELPYEIAFEEDVQVCIESQIGLKFERKTTVKWKKKREQPHKNQPTKYSLTN